ncbi:peptide chain release factor N(5)-glutamine methyltransferase [uncultured Ruminococcus sp.]|uniref:peptide chain release factor N(5)-glutamine methyltransferase n=1 Tax=uncultured Ruminococcus sp. TaxID=165186 RepID=UPI00292DC0E4|nr:peptide chain release factor N(5)-glutamine methyltransferase [uncultured Ruminococcus sp.]
MMAPTSSTTALAQLRKLEIILAHAGTENPAGDAREILAAVMSCQPNLLRLKYETILSSEQLDRSVSMAKRRASGEPIQYVLGMWSFMGRDYKVGQGVLIPRDDTEVLVGEALRMIRSVPRPRIVDLCSGSGIIAITLAKELDATVYAVEKSGEAFAYLKENITLNQADVKAIRADIKDCVVDFGDCSLDMIVSNPPYIRSNDIADLQNEVQYEPRLALDGGESGYDFYELIIRLWTPKLKDGGTIAFELGEGQFDYVANLLKAAGYTNIIGYPDIQGITRAVTAEYGERLTKNG